MSWRYQPVFTVDAAGHAYTLVEAIFDDKGNFTHWTEGDSYPMGETQDALGSDLHRMIIDALCWEPVHRNDLKPGFKFTPRVSMDERRDLVDFVGEIKDTMNKRTIQKPQPN